MPDADNINGLPQLDGVPAGAIIHAEVHAGGGVLALVGRLYQYAPLQRTQIRLQALHRPTMHCNQDKGEDLPQQMYGFCQLQLRCMRCCTVGMCTSVHVATSS